MKTIEPNGMSDLSLCHQPVSNLFRKGVSRSERSKWSLTPEQLASFDTNGFLIGPRILDDAQREFDYLAGAEKALDAAQTHGWTVVSMQRDWRTVFVSET